MKEVIVKITNKNFGCIGVLNKSNTLVGIITDGDLRRHMQNNMLEKKAIEVMSKKPKIIISWNTMVNDLYLFSTFLELKTNINKKNVNTNNHNNKLPS